MTIAALNKSVIGRQDWTSFAYYIATEDLGPVLVNGEVFQWFGIYTEGDVFHLSHIPTGARLSTFAAIESAKGAAVAIGNYLDWSFTRPEDFPAGSAEVKMISDTLIEHGGWREAATPDYERAVIGDMAP